MLTANSIYGRSKTIEDTEVAVKGYLPTNGEPKTYRVVYAVHRLQDDDSAPTDPDKRTTDFIGLVNIKSVDPGALELPEDLTLPSAETVTTLVTEIAYSLLPRGWGKGYATEAVSAALEACRRAQSFWSPFSKVYVRGIVNSDNPKSQRVMDKTGMIKRGVFSWSGDALFVGGRWQTDCDLFIYGLYL